MERLNQDYLMTWWQSWGLNLGLQVMSLEFSCISSTYRKYSTFNFLAVFCFTFWRVGKQAESERKTIFMQWTEEEEKR